MMSVISSTDSKLVGNPHIPHNHQEDEEDSSLEEYLDTTTQVNVLVNRLCND